MQYWVPMNKQVRWGIIGLGRIARAFAEGLKHTPNATLHCVASRNQKRASAFAEEWDVPHFEDSYESLVKRPEIDAIYVATPHSEHKENSILAMTNGKAVLCEKPLAVNSSEVSAMIQCAREKNVLLMEGMWSRFPPLMRKVRELLKSGAIGEIKSLHADFGFRPASRDPQSRLFNPALAGGSMLDIGIYPISLSYMIFGEPESIATQCVLAETGVDEQASFSFKYPNGAMSVLHSSLCGETGQEAFITGSEGSIRIHKQCWKPQKLTLMQSGECQEISMPFVGNGFNYEAEEFSQLVLEGSKECSIMPLEESLKIMKILDHIRAKWGMEYPQDP